MSDTLDIRDFKEKDDELKIAIAQAVRDTQRLVIQPLPSKIIMTYAQFDMLQPDPDLRGLYPKEQIYMTPDNVMEVTIDE